MVGVVLYHVALPMRYYSLINDHHDHATEPHMDSPAASGHRSSSGAAVTCARVSHGVSYLK